VKASAVVPLVGLAIVIALAAGGKKKRKKRRGLGAGLKDQYKQRRNKVVQDYTGMSDEEMEDAAPLLDDTDLYLVQAEAGEKLAKRIFGRRLG